MLNANRLARDWLHKRLEPIFKILLIFWLTEATLLAQILRRFRSALPNLVVTHIVSMLGWLAATGLPRIQVEQVVVGHAAVSIPLQLFEKFLCVTSRLITFSSIYVRRYLIPILSEFIKAFYEPIMFFVSPTTVCWLLDRLIVGDRLFNCRTNRAACCIRGSCFGRHY